MNESHRGHLSWPPVRCEAVLGLATEADVSQCDEKKPSCGGCQKGSRQCKYSYSQGQAFALVMQDPSRMTRYGRSMPSSIVYLLKGSDDSSTLDSASMSSPDPIPVPIPEAPDLHVRGGLLAADGQGVFQTLAPSTLKSKKPSKRVEAHQRRKCHEHLLRLQRQMSLTSHRPSSSDTKLAAMFIDMLRPESPKHQPLFTLGDWVTSIPARIGSSTVVTMAAEFLLHSFNFHGEHSHSREIVAIQTKSKALKELQLSLLASHQAPTYDLVLATKMHYASEVARLIHIHQ